ncbi:MAG: hypothetical protein RMJ17_01680 [Candidatus Aenigmarchaeota archaeon]|nr:hypothetical protein [Candidatus Aenigmarchaeota archaeon]MDW8149287.1 hypothetical protein [Candidatus Aenigmarchaeota archaeon]
MVKLKRYEKNPILKPLEVGYWEAEEEKFNPSVIEFRNKYFMLFRKAIRVKSGERSITISYIGKCESNDGINFSREEVFFGPQYGYEAYGCEDPRITRLDKNFYITYTAVGSFPPRPETVRLALATTKDLKNIEKVGLITPYNSKAGFIFPKKFGSKMCLMFTYNPDIAPSQIAVVYFNELKDLLNENFWKNYDIKNYFLNLRRVSPFVECGAPPIETKEGWLLIMPEIIFENGEFLEFKATAALLDLEDPTKIISQLKEPLLVAEAPYEMERNFNPKKIIFPSGAIVKGDELYVYYGASDKYCCLASCKLEELLQEL